MTPRLVSTIVVAASIVASCSSGDETTGVTSTVAPAESTPATAPPSTTPPTPATAPSTVPPSTVPESTTPPTTAPAGTTPPTSEPNETPPLTAAELADMEAARTALIAIDDFPEGWVEDPVEDVDDDVTTLGFEAEFDACLGRDDTDRVGDLLEALAVTTGDFHPVSDDSPTVSHEVVLAPDEATAIGRMDELTIDGAEQCLADVVQGFYVAAFDENPDLDEIVIGDVILTRTETEREPDLAAGVLIEVPLGFPEQTVSQFLEILYQRQGRALSKLSFSSFGEPFTRDGYVALSDEALSGLAAIGS